MVTEVEMNRKSALPSKDNALRFFRITLVTALKHKLAYMLKSTQMRNQNTLQGSPPFRTALQTYIHSITVYKRFVLIRLFVGDEVKLFRRGRKAFRTPTQRAFKK